MAGVVLNLARVPVDIEVVPVHTGAVAGHTPRSYLYLAHAQVGSKVEVCPYHLLRVHEQVWVFLSYFGR